MRRVWLYRFILVLSPFIVLICIAASLEMAARFYYYWNGISPSSTLFVSSSSVARAHITNPFFSLRSRIGSIKIHHGKPPVYRSELFDKSKGYTPNTRRKNIFVLPPNINTRAIARAKDTGEVIFDINLKTDELGRRITPMRKSKHPSKHLVFFGCSNTFGEGVDQNETIPYFAGEATKDYRPYNLAIGGGSIADSWAYTHVLDQLEDIPEKKGYAVYIFIDDHVERYHGNLNNLDRWIAYRPLVRPDENGKIRFYGQFQDVHPFYVKLSVWAKQSYFLSWIKFNVPPLTDQDFKDFVKVVAEVKDSYEKKFGPENPFIFVFYFQFARQYASIIRPLLEEANIKYLDYSRYDLHSYSDDYVYIKYDGHPNAIAHKFVGELIAKDLKLQ